MLRTEYEEKLASGDREKALVEAVVNVLSPIVSPDIGDLDCGTVLDASDRGAKTVSGANPNQPNHPSYWVLDPIVRTRGFLRGGNALYVVGLERIGSQYWVSWVAQCSNPLLFGQVYNSDDKFVL